MNVDLDKLMALAKAAKPGPWSTDDHRGSIGIVILHGYGGRFTDCQKGEWFDAVEREQAEFIAVANPATIISMIDEIKNLKVEIAKMAEMLDDISENALGREC